jgi:general stress protein 26
VSQTEKNHENLQADAAVAKIRDIVRQAPNGFFCTPGANGARPMNVRKVDADGRLWFLSPSDSRLNEELARDSAVKLYFQGSSNSDFLILDGRATVSTDRRKIKDLWEPFIRTWFSGGVDDPRITVIMVEPSAGHYWDTKHGHAVAGVKMLLGAMLGKPMDDSIEGELTV